MLRPCLLLVSVAAALPADPLSAVHADRGTILKNSLSAPGNLQQWREQQDAKLFDAPDTQAAPPANTDWEHMEDPCRPPILFVPGLGGTVLEVKLKPEYKGPHWMCRHLWSTDSFGRLWPSVAVADPWPPEVRKCFADIFEVRWDNTTKRPHSNPDVEIRAREWGSVSGISNLYEVHDNWGLRMSAVFQGLSRALTHTYGYVDKKSLRGAPYDFRMVADQESLQGQYAQLKSLIEDHYAYSGQCKDKGPRPVRFVTHSLGGPYMLHFLNHYVDQPWKDKHIDTFFSIGAPWAGSFTALRAIVSGESEGLPGHDSEFVGVEQLMGGMLWSIPAHRLEGNRKFMQVGGKEYSVSPADLTELFTKVSPRQGVAEVLTGFVQQTLQADIKPPGTRLVCMHGTGLVTEDYGVYGDITQDPIKHREQVVNASGTVLLTPPHPQLQMPLQTNAKESTDELQGDAVVSLRSLALCNTWSVAANQGHAITYHTFQGGEHKKMVSDDDFVNFLLPKLIEL
eukprot:comp23349_c0_seq1/m.38544 comp23349_c0_seq1/g.38544  ORF comp23349_c0_seq1/g.38544 comp23349_c0_seq1/m.38544 type:complete len:510 (-) comp23349_c0_seq1:382-1911(-)